MRPPAKKRKQWRSPFGAKERGALHELARVHGEEGAIARVKVSALTFYRAAAGFPLTFSQRRHLWDAIHALIHRVDHRQLTMAFPTGGT